MTGFAAACSTTRVVTMRGAAVGARRGGCWRPGACDAGQEDEQDEYQELTAVHAVQRSPSSAMEGMLASGLRVSAAAAGRELLALPCTGTCEVMGVASHEKHVRVGHPPPANIIAPAPWRVNGSAASQP